MKVAFKESKFVVLVAVQFAIFPNFSLPSLKTACKVHHRPQFQLAVVPPSHVCRVINPIGCGYIMIFLPDTDQLC